MLKNVKILCVDDAPINLMLFEINFSEKYTVITAESGWSGLEILDRQPDILIVFSDMKMPNMNGIEFIEKAKEKFPDKKFFILTGFETTTEIQSAIDSGLILKCFRKPFNIKEMDDAILEVIG